MKMFNLKNQRGAVLAFCLVMLLLLTLAGTRMIQQNKQQLEMANSGRLLTQRFSDTESLLEKAKNAINDQDGHIDPTDLAVNHSKHQCTPSLYKTSNGDDDLDGLDNTVDDDDSDGTPNGSDEDYIGIPRQNIMLAGEVPGVSEAIILSVKCRSYSNLNYIEEICSTYDNSEISCNQKTGCIVDFNPPANDTRINALKEFNQSSNLCYQKYDPLSTSSGNEQGKCPREIYTIQLTSTDSSGTTRKVVSDHVVGCGG